MIRCSTQLFNGTSYGFRLVATNLSGDSAPSNEAWARPLPPLPRAPGNLRAYAGSSHVTLKWDPCQRRLKTEQVATAEN
ncbi:hypothetical protein Pa4123_27450 [Phytohabitans aurantiacus]|uniref:Fibronectin type-III domain-containing protein n=1 Tax=Phytohabitans aurantiacus TaxID=3016789 RepID=A0ABQ5QVS9_9ACTN|nr:hypothetical protein Pa4123_27450 [Phytohabitans aurantiacus]